MLDFLWLLHFAIAALLGGQLDAAWARWSRPWTTLAWVFLTIGIMAGSNWAYYELGWGGWWFWDAVENASFMPWLVGTALIHSLAVTEKRGSFKAWTVLLAICAFSLSLLGTFLVRSGVLTSVHAFATDPRRGIFILAFLVIVIGGSLMLFAWRAPTMGRGGKFDVVSRESFLLANNVFLAVAALSVLLGTLYPLFLDALGLGKISVGPPYFDAVFALFVVGLVPGALRGSPVGHNDYVSDLSQDQTNLPECEQVHARTCKATGAGAPLMGCATMAPHSPNGGTVTANRALRRGRRTITYSPKVFIPLTKLCRDRCGYCTFAQPPARTESPYLSIEEVVALARAGARAGCHEALFTLGEAPEERYDVARRWLRDHGYESTVDYLANAARAVLDETGLLPHANPGALGEAELGLLREVAPSQGMMLETMRDDLACHRGAPDKAPARRVATLEAAGRLGVPFTTGILVGIGENRRDRADALAVIARSHERHGHIQEVIVQNFLPKAGTAMSGSPECDEGEFLDAISLARMILPPRNTPSGTPQPE